ncbi:hypothetical protein MMC26_000866 [Xylographa opegraphella]|nr:hypothetical protein [Xylographa opegraphella]
MALSQCNEDVLLTIASYLHHDLQPISYDMDFEERRRVFHPLVLVCRRLSVIYTPLLYRTLSIRYDRNTWPAKDKQRWLQQNPDRRIMDALFQTLHQVPARRFCTCFLEVSWGLNSDNPGDHNLITNILNAFPRVRGLHIFAPQRRYIDRRTFAFLPGPSGSWSEEITELRLTQTVTASILPIVFSLPNLRTLELAAVDTQEIIIVPIPPRARPVRCGIVHLFLTAGLNSNQLVQLLARPAALETLVYNHTLILAPWADFPWSKSFQAALQPTRHSLVTLKIVIVDRQGNAGIYYPYDTTLLDLSSFPFLKDLQVPSHLLVGNPTCNYSRDNIRNLLPSSLRSFEINFSAFDILFSRDWKEGWAFDPFVDDDWLYAIYTDCSVSNRFPHLKTIIASDTGCTKDRGQATELQNIFADLDVQLHIAPRTHLACEDEEYERDEDMQNRQEYWNNGAESSSSRRTDMEWLEEADDEEMQWLDEWEGFDEMMVSEQERVAQS